MYQFAKPANTAASFLSLLEYHAGKNIQEGMYQFAKPANTAASYRARSR